MNYAIRHSCQFTLWRVLNYPPCTLMISIADAGRKSRSPVSDPRAPIGVAACHPFQSACAMAWISPEARDLPRHL